MSTGEDNDKAFTTISLNSDPHLVARQLADLRLQVNAIEAAAKDSSLPEGLRATRRTVFWSTVLVCVALVSSSFVRACTEAHDLERRVEALERATKGL